MLHEPAPEESGPDHASGYKTRLGVVMFFIYAIIYAGFVAIPLYDNKLMAKKVFMGMNLAVTYGYALIIFALVLALIYNAMCTAKEKQLNTPDNEKKEN